MTRFLVLVLSSTGAVLALCPPGARAQDAPAACDVSSELDAAEQALEATQFEAAVLALDRASMCPATRALLIRTLVLRSVVAYADERLGALEDALRALVSLGLPERPPVLPPPVARRYDQLRQSMQPITLAASPIVTSTSDSRRVGIAARAQHDAAGLVRRIEVHARLPGQRFRLLGDDLRLEVPNLDAVRIEYFLTASGPGDAPVATLGAENAPEILRVAAVPRDSTPVVVAVVVAGILLVVAGIAVGVAALLTDGFRNDDVSVIPPSR